MSRRLTSQLCGYPAGLATVALITAFYVHEAVFKTTTIVLTYLLAILIASTIWGLGVSVFMTVVATLVCDYYFFLPIGILSIDDPQDWVALISFLVTSVIGSELSARARRQAQEATRQRNEMRHLYEFSQPLLRGRNPHEILKEIPSQLVNTFQARNAVLYLPERQTVHLFGTANPRFETGNMKAILLAGEFELDEERRIYLGPVRLDTQVIGSFGISGALVSRDTLEAVGAMIASAIDRARAIEQLGKTEATRESERLKSVLLDAIAHDFKTPLTSIKAAATSLIDDLTFNKKQRGELLSVIDEECDRINQVIGEAIEMATLDAGDVKLQIASYPIEDLLSAVLDDCASIGDMRVIHAEMPKATSVRCDLFWTKKVFGHLITNADLYSSPGEAIEITAEEKDGFVFFHISDLGPGIEESELRHIFDKFYRGKGQRHRVPGTGMGLAVARAIVEAHGGILGVTSEVGHGSVFTFHLPIDSESNSERDAGILNGQKEN